MEKIFKKYLESVCSPEEFNRIAQFIGEKRNDPELDTLIKESIAGHIQDTEELSYSNPQLADNLLQKIELQEARVTRNRLKLYKWGLRVAAVLIIGLLAGIIFFPRGAAKVDSSRYAEITVPNGEKSRVMLPDSSIVWLNSGSVLKYPANFNENNREVFLSGEGFFDVHKNKKSKFRVRSGMLTVTVYGTSFNIKNYQYDNLQEISVASGLVGISGRNREFRRLSKGQQALLDKKTNNISYEECNISTLALWRRNELVFDNVPFSELKLSLERWYGVDIVIGGSFRANDSYTFKVKTETLREMLEMLKIITPLEYEIDGKDVTIMGVK